MVLKGVLLVISETLLLIKCLEGFHKQSTPYSVFPCFLINLVGRTELLKLSTSIHRSLLQEGDCDLNIDLLSVHIQKIEP